MPVTDEPQNTYPIQGMILITVYVGAVISYYTWLWWRFRGTPLSERERHSNKFKTRALMLHPARNLVVAVILTLFLIMPWYFYLFG